MDAMDLGDLDFRKPRRLELGPELRPGQRPCDASRPLRLAASQKTAGACRRTG